MSFSGSSPTFCCCPRPLLNLILSGLGHLSGLHKSNSSTTDIGSESSLKESQTKSKLLSLSRSPLLCSLPSRNRKPNYAAITNKKFKEDAPQDKDCCINKPEAPPTPPPRTFGVEPMNSLFHSEISFHIRMASRPELLFFFLMNSSI